MSHWPAGRENRRERKRRSSKEGHTVIFQGVSVNFHSSSLKPQRPNQQHTERHTTTCCSSEHHSGLLLDLRQECPDDYFTVKWIWNTLLMISSVCFVRKQKVVNWVHMFHLGLAVIYNGCFLQTAEELLCLQQRALDALGNTGRFITDSVWSDAERPLRAEPCYCRVTTTSSNQKDVRSSGQLVKSASSSKSFL